MTAKLPAAQRRSAVRLTRLTPPTADALTAAAAAAERSVSALIADAITTYLAEAERSEQEAGR